MLRAHGVAARGGSMAAQAHAGADSWPQPQAPASISGGAGTPHAPCSVHSSRAISRIHARPAMGGLPRGMPCRVLQSPTLRAASQACSCCWGSARAHLAAAAFFRKSDSARKMSLRLASSSSSQSLVESRLHGCSRSGQKSCCVGSPLLCENCLYAFPAAESLSSAALFRCQSASPACCGLAACMDGAAAVITGSALPQPQPQPLCAPCTRWPRKQAAGPCSCATYRALLPAGSQRVPVGARRPVAPVLVPGRAQRLLPGLVPVLIMRVCSTQAHA